MKSKGKHVFCSGCFDILHAGHIQFFEDAKALGDHLTVSFCSEEVLWIYKKKRPSIPDSHKRRILESLKMIDAVITSTDCTPGIDYKTWFLENKPDILAVTEDDAFREEKQALCAEVGAKYVLIPKRLTGIAPVSTSSIIATIKAPKWLPLRVDFAGGWLDVPNYSREGAYIVNCAISPMVSMDKWIYEKGAGLGGSAAWVMLNGKDGVSSEIASGVGWQDPAIIHETGLCVWESGTMPSLYMKKSGDFLRGRMALLYCEKRDSDASEYTAKERDFNHIEMAGEVACRAVVNGCIDTLAGAIEMSYKVQLAEGMCRLPHIPESLAFKYCGAGHGGYALYLFRTREVRDFNALKYKMIPIEPYCK